MKKCFLFFVIIIIQTVEAQLYFPPNNTDVWTTMPIQDIDWCQEKIDALYTFLEENNTKSFIILKDGKIVLEQYFNGHTATLPWYWASAGKTLTATMVGIAEQENFLNINNKTSDYLGLGWTSCTLAQENEITVKNQLSMTTGLDDGVTDQSCYSPSCFQFLATAGSRWAYHNGPYTILDQVIANATGVTLNQYTTTKLKTPTGMTGSFVTVDNNNVFFSNARSMARFGLLMLNNGNWNGNQILNTNYFNQMVNTSQNINKSYGYLWWLNGKESFMVPQLQFTFNGFLMPNAPADTFMALGRDGQFINVVPSQNLVFIRMGEAPSNDLVPFLLNDQIWSYINDLPCDMSTNSADLAIIEVYPNPASHQVNIRIPHEINLDACQLIIFNTKGQKLRTILPKNNNFSVDINEFSQQVLLFYLFDREKVLKTKLIKK